MDENTKNALKLLGQEDTGVLSTHSLDVLGYPFGSIAPYSLDESFSPIILVSDLAQHTKNMNENNKVSLTVSETSHVGEKQALARFTFLGEAAKIDSSSDESKYISEMYLREFPSAKGYFETHDFNFYRLSFHRGRYIGGFGKIFWLEKDQWNNKNVFSFEEMKGIIDHMNEDHMDSLRNYCRHYRGMNVSDDFKVKMTRIDQFGFSLIHKNNKLSFDFENEVNDSSSARKELVDMAKKAKS